MAMQRIKTPQNANVKVLGNTEGTVIIDEPLYKDETSASAEAATLAKKKSAGAVDSRKKECEQGQAEEKKSAGGHGGVRTNAGRKPVADKARQRNVIANNEEWDEVKRRAAAEGYSSISAFVIDRVLCRN